MSRIVVRASSVGDAISADRTRSLADHVESQAKENQQ